MQRHAVLITLVLVDGLDGLVVRWEDGADRYFSCRFTLDTEDVALAPAFLAGVRGQSSRLVPGRLTRARWVTRPGRRW